MDNKASIYASIRDYLGHEVMRGLGVKLWEGRYVDEMETRWLPGSRPGFESPLAVRVKFQAPGCGFTPGDRAWVVVKMGYAIDVPGPIDLAEVSLEEFHAWLGEVKAVAERWS
jgi:hypothetical protein